MRFRRLNRNIGCNRSKRERWYKGVDTKFSQNTHALLYKIVYKIFILQYKFKNMEVGNILY